MLISIPEGIYRKSITERSFRHPMTSRTMFLLSFSMKSTNALMRPLTGCIPLQIRLPFPRQDIITEDYGSRNIPSGEGIRIPGTAYHRLDFSFNYNFNIGRMESNLNLSIYNVYNRHNAFAVYFRDTGPSWNAEEAMPQVPVLRWLNCICFPLFRQLLSTLNFRRPCGNYYYIHCLLADPTPYRMRGDHGPASLKEKPRKPWLSKDRSLRIRWRIR